MKFGQMLRQSNFKVLKSYRMFSNLNSMYIIFKKWLKKYVILKEIL